MDNSLTKYFTGELTPEEKEELLASVHIDAKLQQDFIDNQHLMASLSMLPQEDDREKARLKLSELMQKIKNK
ncbi:hypothetical protein [Bacteroides reticulotermitis]|uniref:Anti-sigma factor n=2 Tax=Bacteroides reticulotermitis TaxID=1133319 RepID=W4USN4_9BACE|nr:hypothetical protein [Bacteroides reticulotermitis]MBB4045120.1 hypothetical protein [Bacteroides reticulotermitis]GAE83931.1 hypothetical protein JCM10512_2237 [Bacteroides reticulotermitis JCM 10512]